MSNLLDNEELHSGKTTMQTVETSADILTMDVYEMKIVSLERKDDKSGNPYLLMAIDTGFKKRDSEYARLLYKTFPLKGVWSNNKLKIEQLVSFCKEAIGFNEFSEENLKKVVGNRIAVATKKDKEGYISFWYARNINDLEKVKKAYVPKDDSNGISPSSSKGKKDFQSIYEGMETENAKIANGFEGVSNDEGDDLPF